MIVTISPAKILDFTSEIQINQSTTPVYEKEALELNALMRNLSVDEIANLLSINPQLTQSTVEYALSFDLPRTPCRQAVFAYNGIAYQGLDASTFSKEDFEFAQKHLVLFSAQYGMLRPLDLIRPYRLEMQAKLKNSRGNNLYDFWIDTLTQHLSHMLLQDDNIWINLTSNEYFKSIDKKKLPKNCKIITPIFKEVRGTGYKQVVVYAKKARGMMGRFIVQNRIENLEYIKAFDTEGYSYSEQLSTKGEWVFIR